MSLRRFDAIVVGGGAVGAATAVALMQAGVTTALIERGEAPASFDPGNYDQRVYALSPGTMRFLDALGVWGAIQGQRTSPYESMLVWEDSLAQALSFSAAEANAPQLGHIVENKLLLSALWQRLDGVAVFENAKIEQWSADLGGAHLRLADGNELDARLLIAADGADSALRSRAGIDCTSWPYPQQAVVCHVQTALPHRRTAYQRFLPTGPLAFLPLADGRSSIVWSSSEAWLLQTLPDAEFISALGAASQGVLGEIRACSPRVSYPLRLLHAQQYVAERLALVGDAAHVVHPLAGQGVNMGLADAEALAGVLADGKQAGRDLGRLRLLKQYERARRADTLEMLALTEGLFRIYADSREPAALLRKGGMGAVQKMRGLRQFFMQRALR